MYGDRDLPAYDIYKQRESQAYYENEDEEKAREEAEAEQERTKRLLARADTLKAKKQDSLGPVFKLTLKSLGSIKNILPFGQPTQQEEEEEEEDPYKPLQQRITEVESEKLSREELLRWVKYQAEKLDREGKLLILPRSWAATGSKQEDKAMRYLGFLFVNYRVDCWWFEFFIMFYKLFMTSILAFIWRGSASQFALGFLMTLILLMIFITYRPIESTDLTRLQICALWVQMLHQFLGLMVLTGAFVEIIGAYRCLRFLSNANTLCCVTDNVPRLLPTASPLCGLSFLSVSFRWQERAVGSRPRR